MRRLLAGLFAALFVILAATPVAAAASVAAPAAPAAPRPPGSWILVDLDTGAVLDTGNARIPMRPASVTKVLTALVAVLSLPADAGIPVSARASGMPAAKIDMRSGQTWDLDAALQSLLLASANDAAAAIAERVGGSLEGFSGRLAAAAGEIGMEDSPVLRDPAGLDDEFSVGGGNLISARDLAIVARAALALPVLRTIVAEREHRFRGGDGNDHRVVNHNRMLTTYPGAIGVKTGYTRRAGHSLIAAATRNGRTMLAVTMSAPEPYGFATGLLDRGFGTPVAAEAAMEHLAPMRPLNTLAGGTGAVPAAPATGTSGTPRAAATLRNPAPAGAAPAGPADNPLPRRVATAPPVLVAAATGRQQPRLRPVIHIQTHFGVLAFGIVPAGAIMLVARPRRRSRSKPVRRHRRSHFARARRPAPATEPTPAVRPTHAGEPAPPAHATEPTPAAPPTRARRPPRGGRPLRVHARRRALRVSRGRARSLSA